MNVIDLLFVDGDHSFEGVSRDWENFSPLLKPGAWVAFHDVGWADGVRAVVQRQVKAATTTSRALRNLWIGRVR
ncbi:MAG: class I SAM-dependent methyltransferase [Burkholderiaceae bacterium]|nr:class I SAM-dependent methyltransferase [Burkholderiaceae bacterium]